MCSIHDLYLETYFIFLCRKSLHLPLRMLFSLSILVPFFFFFLSFHIGPQMQCWKDAVVGNFALVLIFVGMILKGYPCCVCHKLLIDSFYQFFFIYTSLLHRFIFDYKQQIYHKKGSFHKLEVYFSVGNPKLRWQPGNP